MVVSDVQMKKDMERDMGGDWHEKIGNPFLLYGTVAKEYYMVPNYTDGIRSVDWFESA